MADVDEVGPVLVWDWSHAFKGRSDHRRGPHSRRRTGPADGQYRRRRDRHPGPNQLVITPTPGPAATAGNTRRGRSLEPASADPVRPLPGNAPPSPSIPALTVGRGPRMPGPVAGRWRGMPVVAFLAGAAARRAQDTTGPQIRWPADPSACSRRIWLRPDKPHGITTITVTSSHGRLSSVNG
jgi:hypothetical protein